MLHGPAFCERVVELVKPHSPGRSGEYQMCLLFRHEDILLLFQSRPTRTPPACLLPTGNLCIAHSPPYGERPTRRGLSAAEWLVFRTSAEIRQNQHVRPAVALFMATI